MDGFLERWSKADKKQLLIDELAEQGILIEALKDEVGKDLDVFDLICHVAFDKPPLTRRERANEVIKRDYFSQYEGKAKKVLEAVLHKYIESGVTSIEDTSVLNLKPLADMGSPVELVNAFGKRKDFEKAVSELEDQLYITA